MIVLSKMVGGEITVSKKLTYDKLKTPDKDVAPVVVWNATAKCNLRCIHCYADASSMNNNSHNNGIYARGNIKMKELTTNEVKSLIDDLSSINVPVILFSGGEPLMREDIFELMLYAKNKGISPSLSTNGTLIDNESSEILKKIGVSYVGVSLDGVRETNDRFRGLKGAFDKALEGLLNAKNAGILTGIRFTVTKYNIKDVPYILDLLVENEIPRFCLYHLVPSGRAGFKDDISVKERRELMEWLFKKSIELRDDKEKIEILTVDNPADGVFFYLKLREIDEDIAEKALEFLKQRGGDSSGYKIADIDMFGNVHPNQFWWDYTIGNVRDVSFSKLWINPTDPLLIKLREKTRYIKGERCGRCRFKELCGGFRLRALRAGDLWGDDPSCYLKDDEIGIT